MTLNLWELAVFAVVSAAIGAGMHSGYCGSIIDGCHERAVEIAGATYGEHAARAIEFAKCMSASKYDPMYDYNRFKGK